MAFATTGDLKTIVFYARPPVVRFLDQRSRERGILVENQKLFDLFAGSSSDNTIAYPPQLYVMQGERRRALNVTFSDCEFVDDPLAEA